MSSHLMSSSLPMDSVFDRMLMAFGTSPPKAHERPSMDSERKSFVSESEPASEEDEWIPEARSTKNPDPYVIHRPFDFASFHHSLGSKQESGFIADNAHRSKLPGQQDVPWYTRHRTVSEHQQQPKPGKDAPSNACAGKENAEPINGVSLVRRLTGGKSSRPRRQQVKLRHFGGRVFGVLHATHSPIDPCQIGQGAEFRSGATAAHAQNPAGRDIPSSDTMEQTPLDRPMTPLCVKIARSQSVRSTPPRRKPVPRLVSHNRAESEPFAPHNNLPAPPIPRKFSQRGDASHMLAHAPPRPPKSALRRMATVFQSHPASASKLYSTRSIHAHAPHSSVTSLDAHDMDVPPLDSDHSDTEETDSAPELGSVGIPESSRIMTHGNIDAIKMMPHFLAPPVQIPL